MGLGVAAIKQDFNYDYLLRYRISEYINKIHFFFLPIEALAWNKTGHRPHRKLKQFLSQEVD